VADAKEAAVRVEIVVRAAAEPANCAETGAEAEKHARSAREAKGCETSLRRAVVTLEFMIMGMVAPGGVKGNRKHPPALPARFLFISLFLPPALFTATRAAQVTLTSTECYAFKHMATYFEQSLAKLEEFEGSIPWMYRDTVGKVTVGVGLMLPDTTAARLLPFHFGTRAATHDEIAAEFARVDTLPMGRAALFYRKDGCPELPRAAIDSALRQVLAGFESTIKAALPGYDHMPDSVKMALLDMAYNLGPVGLLNGYPQLIRAVKAGDWSAAAANSFRHGPGAARNEWTRSMFSTATIAAGAADGTLKKLGYGIVGLAASLLEKVRK
jgi:GH24 family phage-related lysozyme (muramidase)